MITSLLYLPLVSVTIDQQALSSPHDGQRSELCDAQIQSSMSHLKRPDPQQVSVVIVRTTFKISK